MDDVAALDRGLFHVFIALGGDHDCHLQDVIITGVFTAKTGTKTPPCFYH